MQQLNKNNDAQLNKIRDAEIKGAAAYAYAYAFGSLLAYATMMQQLNKSNSYMFLVWHSTRMRTLNLLK
jgi:hypothetical protein